jgi:DNA-binding MarR family transcriptional regulator
MTMDTTKASRDIMELFIKAVHKYNALEKVPSKIDSKHNLYHSERHLLDKIGDQPGVNITEFSRVVGITKGAVSQVVKKLENKGFIRRYKSSSNDKEVFLELTRAGRDIYIKHKKTNEETLKPLIEKLKKYPDDKIDFLIAMFIWIGECLDQGKKQMEEHK